MGPGAGRVLVVAAACLVWVTGCGTSAKMTGLGGSQSDDAALAEALDTPADSQPTGTVPGIPGQPGIARNGGSPTVLGKDPYDDLSLGKKYFRGGNFGLAEKHFRQAVELHPRDAEAWLGLAACYDRLKRFDLADRAYGQVVAIVGETPEIMNNRGFSYILRGDYRRARQVLLAAQARAPDNPYIRNNLDLLNKAQRGKAIN